MSAAGEGVWTREAASIAGEYHIHIEYDQMLLMRYFKAGEALDRDAMEIERSALPIPAAERIHALEQCAAILRESFENLTEAQVVALAERSRKVLANLEQTK